MVVSVFGIVLAVVDATNKCTFVHDVRDLSQLDFGKRRTLRRSNSDHEPVSSRIPGIDLVSRCIRRVDDRFQIAIFAAPQPPSTGKRRDELMQVIHVAADRSLVRIQGSGVVTKIATGSVACKRLQQPHGIPEIARCTEARC